MPVDLAMPLFLSKGDFLVKRGPRIIKPLRSCLHLEESLKNSQRCPQPQARLDHVSSLKTKKKVSFADHWGLALTMVKVFSEFEDPIDIPCSVEDLSCSSLSLLDDDDLVLDFSPPSADYLLFRQRLERDYVCLEHCTLKERTLAGTVKVKNLAFEKSVKLRVTFDTWKSHTDIECQYIKYSYTDEDRDTFAFEMTLPSDMRLHERVEFAILYEVGPEQYWDNNGGQNYKIIPAMLKKGERSQTGSPPRHDSHEWGIHFDRYGSPRCSHGIFPDWPGYAGYENIGPYY